jgi:hypothetical protein
MAMPKYTVTLQVFAATGDVVEVEAWNTGDAERRAHEIAQQRYKTGRYEFELQEVTTSSIEKVAADPADQLRLYRAYNTADSFLHWAATEADALAHLRDYFGDVIGPHAVRGATSYYSSPHAAELAIETPEALAALLNEERELTK